MDGQIGIFHRAGAHARGCRFLRDQPGKFGISGQIIGT